MPRPPRTRTSARMLAGDLQELEAQPGFEPGMEVLQTSALPLGYCATSQVLRTVGRAQEGYVYRNASGSALSVPYAWSGKRDSNPRLRPWQGRTLPLSYSRSPL